MQAWQDFVHELVIERYKPVPAPVTEPLGEAETRRNRELLALALGLDPTEADYERVVEPPPPRPSRKAAAAVRRYEAAVDDLDHTAA